MEFTQVIIFLMSQAVLYFRICFTKFSFAPTFLTFYYPFNAGGLHPYVALKVSQRVVWPPVVDGIKLQLTCKAIVKNGHEAITFDAIDWTGGSVRKSLWVKLGRSTKTENSIERAVLFKPWLESHAGMYTCHLVIKDNYNSIFMMHKTIEVKGNNGCITM